jgi:DNA-binding IclR family transcriptional regulator
MAGNTARAGATATSRALAIFGAFDPDHRQLTLSELARRADLSLTTTHRVVAELTAWGALNRRPGGEYVVGRRLWDLGLLAPVQTNLRETAAPFLSDLYAATLATVHLAVRDGIEALYIDRLAGRASVPVVSQIGSRLPLHATGVGKVLLAHAPEPVRRAALSRLTRITAHTITQPGLLNRQLGRALREGFAQANEEMSLGAYSVAVPIRDHSGTVVAALGIVVPELGRHRPRLVAALQVAAQGVGRSLP